MIHPCMFQMWSVEEDAELITLVENYPWLFNKFHPSFKDNIKKQNSWLEIQQFISVELSGKLFQYCCSYAWASYLVTSDVTCARDRDYCDAFVDRDNETQGCGVGQVFDGSDTPESTLAPTPDRLRPYQ